MSGFRPDPGQLFQTRQTKDALFEGFPQHPVGRLGIDIHDAFAFFDPDERIRCLAVLPTGMVFQVDRYLRQQQFLAPACIFHMADHLRSVQVHMSNEPIGSAQKSAFYHILVSQG